MNRVLAFAVFAAAAAAPAFADIPPPPYHGPSHAVLGGLDFDRGEGLRPPGRPGRRSYDIARLTRCHAASRNCRAVTRAGVIGWGVAKVDGEWIAYGDIGALQAAFTARRGPVRVTFIRVDGTAETEVEVALDRR
jgi:hypothetical protein